MCQDFKLNDESAETDQLVARVHKWRILNQSLILGDIMTPARYGLAEFYEFRVLSAGTVVPAAALRARYTQG